MNRSANQKRSPHERLSSFTVVIFALTALCLALSLAFRLSPAFSDLYNRSIGQALRLAFGTLTSPIPFSLAEAMLLLSPVALVLLLSHAIRCHTQSLRAMLVYIVELISIACIFFILFTLLFGAAYHTPSVASAQKLDLDRQKVSAEELYDTALHLAKAVNTEAEQLYFQKDGFSVMPYTKEDMNAALMRAYDTFCAHNEFLGHFKSRVKPVLLSRAMSYTHVTGVYSFFTGEANLNVDFPDYTLPFTAAHELAHQRGIAREDEANFIAYLVCIGSDDPYIRYSGYLSVYEYVVSALYSADPELYFEVRRTLSPRVQSELSAYSDFFDQYRDSAAGEISGTVNDTYLKLQGTEGTKSYGLVVDLAVAYDKKLYP